MALRLVTARLNFYREKEMPDTVSSLIAGDSLNPHLRSWPVRATWLLVFMEPGFTPTPTATTYCYLLVMFTECGGLYV